MAERPRRVALGVEVEVAHHHRHQALAVGGVVDREGRLEPDLGGLAAQDPHAGRVEGHDPHRLGPRADQGGDALAHLGRRLVGEGDGQHLPGLHPTGGQQVGDPVGEHPGLARPGAGDDQQRAALVQHRLALLRVEPLEQRLGVGVPAARRRRGRAPRRPPGPRWGRLGRRRRSREPPQRSGGCREGADRRGRGRRRACSCWLPAYVPRATDPSSRGRWWGYRVTRAGRSG